MAALHPTELGIPLQEGRPESSGISPVSQVPQVSQPPNVPQDPQDPQVPQVRCANRPTRTDLSTRSKWPRHPKKPDYVFSSKRIQRLGYYLRKMNLYFEQIKATSPRIPHGAVDCPENPEIPESLGLARLAPQQAALEQAILRAHGVDDLDGLLQQGLDLLAMQPPDPALGLVARVIGDAKLLCGQGQARFL